MARSSSAPSPRKTSHPAGNKKTERRLHAVESTPRPGGVGELLSGKVSAKPKRAKKGGRKRLVEAVPEALNGLVEVYVAGRKIEREISFKLRFAEQRVKDYCVRRFAEIYASTGERPSSIDYQGERSQFTFVQTKRTTLTAEKVEALRSLSIPIDDYTELRGLRVNYEAIRRHKLEGSLRKALEEMGVKPEVLEETFEPVVQLKDSFFTLLDNIVTKSLEKGEELSDKMKEVLAILQPANQVRNADLPSLSANECFDLIHAAEISVPDVESELDVA